MVKNKEEQEQEEEEQEEQEEEEETWEAGRGRMKNTAKNKEEENEVQAKKKKKKKKKKGNHYSIVNRQNFNLLILVWCRVKNEGYLLQIDLSLIVVVCKISSLTITPRKGSYIVIE